MMQQAGSPHRWWSRALRRHSFLHNVTKHLHVGLSPYELRFGVAFNGPLLAFDSEVSYKSAVSDPNGPGNKFGPSSKQGVLVGYFVNPGGAWSKDYIVFDLEAVRDNKDCKRIRTRRCGEVFQKRGVPRFPMLTMEARGSLVLPSACCAETRGAAVRTSCRSRRRSCESGCRAGTCPRSSTRGSQAAGEG